MFSGFNLTLSEDIVREHRLIDEYYTTGQKMFDSQKLTVRKSLDSYLNPDGSLSASQIETDWFEKIEVNVFLSHSHADEKAVIGLAGFLYENFGITSFVDSCIWGYADDLLRALNNKYSTTGTGKYDYGKCNFASNHVHLILNGALAKMINHTECLIFVNTPNSIKLKDITDKSKTASPWIYSELLMATEFPHQKLQYYRPLVHSEQYSREASRLQVEYDVEVDKLCDLHFDDLYLAKYAAKKDDPLAILNQLYIGKKLIKCKDDII